MPRSSPDTVDTTNPLRIENNPNTLRAVSDHELRHLLAGAASIGTLYLHEPAKAEEIYDAAIAHVAVTKRGDEVTGETAIQIPGHDEVAERVAALQSLGPCADFFNKTNTNSLADFMAVIREAGSAEKMSVLQRLAGLSDADLRLAKSWDGPPLTPVVVIRAAYHLESRLGFARFSKMSDSIRTISNQAHSPFHLANFVPLYAARTAAEAAKKELAELLDPGPTHRALVGEGGESHG